MVTDQWDNNAVPVRPAATVMLLANRPELEVLMLRRTKNMAFAGDMWVFPGGRVDQIDKAAQLETIMTGLTDAEASARLEVDAGGLAWWLAAIRETLEEAGLLLAANTTNVDVEAMRDRVRDDESSFVYEITRHGITLDATTMEDVARFITPSGPPRRFDARFFLGMAPTDQLPHSDDSEIVDWRWIKPADAIADESMNLMMVTQWMLEKLIPFQNAEDALTYARNQSKYTKFTEGRETGWIKL
jgi:8-oxo-dGTP pyrophosphatase MutT (NUDIX family)